MSGNERVKRGLVQFFREFSSCSSVFDCFMLTLLERFLLNSAYESSNVLDYFCIALFVAIFEAIVCNQTYSKIKSFNVI